ncbi:MAG: TPM domain-containing protein [Cytophagaceae bacterium]
MRPALLFSLFIFFITACSSPSPDLNKEYEFKDIPNPTKVDGSFLIDVGDYISEGEEQQLKAHLRKIEKDLSVQVAVVLFPKMKYDNIDNFAFDLFNYWGIGQADKDNGLLIIASVEDRRWRIETGSGTEAVLTDARCANIGENALVPNFRNLQYGKGIEEALMMVETYIYDPKYADDLISQHLKAKEEAEGLSVFWYILFFTWLAVAAITIIIYFVKKKKKTLFVPQPFQYSSDTLESDIKTHATISKVWWVLIYILLPLLVFIPLFDDTSDYKAKSDGLAGALVFGYLLVIFWFLDRKLRIRKYANKYAEDQYSKVRTLRKSDRHLWVLALLFPFVFILYLIWAKIQLGRMRRKSMPCPKCSTTMKLLSESADDEKLLKGQLTEEKIGSVDYDVRVCPGCNHNEILAYPKAWSKYSKCPSCKYKTFYVESTETVVSATTVSEGRGIRHYQCKNCAHKKDESYTIPRVETSSGGSGGSGGGSSFGGGSSSGGGASGSW